MTDSERGYIDLDWTAWLGTGAVNIYRDSSYLTTVKGASEYRDHDGQPDSSYALVAFRNGEYSSMGKSMSPERIRPKPPVITQLGDVGGRYMSVVWYQPPGIDGVNVYRNGEYIDTVHSGTMYSDYSGRVGDEYYLISFRDDLYSSRSLSRVATAGSDQISAAVERQPDGATVVIRATEESGIRSVLVYRNDSGHVSPVPSLDNQLGEVCRGCFVDSNPVRGASYGVLQVRDDGSALPVVTVTPQYADGPDQQEGQLTPE